MSEIMRGEIGEILEVFESTGISSELNAGR